MNSLNPSPRPNDVPVEPGPTDSVTKLEFNPAVDYLAVGSWDNQVRIQVSFDIQIVRGWTD
jgi:mRNA export factor